jgi:hypothetical protein
METYNHLRVVKKNAHEFKKETLDLHQWLENDEPEDEYLLRSAYLGSLRHCLEINNCQGLIEAFWDIEHCLQEISSLRPYLLSFHSQISSNLLRVIWELTQSSDPSGLCLERCMSALRLSVEEEISQVASEMEELSTVKKKSEH